MKKTLLAALLTFFVFTVKSQSYGSHVELYLNDLLVNPENVKLDDPVTNIHPMKKIDSKWDPFYFDQIKYKKFEHDTLAVIQTKQYKQYPDRPSEDHLVLKSKKTGNLYEFQYEFGLMPFKVAKQESVINKDVFCPDIIETTDRFSGVKNVTSPEKNTITFSKLTKDGQTNYFISCNTGCPNPDGINKTGVIFLFSDGSKKEFGDAKVDVKVSDSKYVRYLYSCDILISKEDIKVFVDKRIIAFRLYIADRDVSEFDGLMYQSYLYCLLTK